MTNEELQQRILTVLGQVLQEQTNQGTTLKEAVGRLSGVEERLGTVEERMNTTEQALERIEEKVEGQGQQLKRIEEQLNAGFEAISAEFEQQENQRVENKAEVDREIELLKKAHLN
jgi:chromosome segregation ATPase